MTEYFHSLKNLEYFRESILWESFSVRYFYYFGNLWVFLRIYNLIFFSVEYFCRFEKPWVFSRIHNLIFFFGWILFIGLKKKWIFQESIIWDFLLVEYLYRFEKKNRVFSRIHNLRTLSFRLNTFTTWKVRFILYTWFRLIALGRFETK